MGSPLRTAGAALLIVAAGFFLYRLLSPSLPVSKPVIVHGGTTERPLSAAIEDFHPEQIVTVLGKDGIPAIHDPVLVPAGQANLDDDDLVIGVELLGEARAYPVKVLSAHEIVNDEIRGRPFAVTW